MFVLARALVYATLFIGFLLVFLPARVLSSFGVRAPPHFGAMQGTGILLVLAGAALALSCILTFVFVGKGTPAPFDPPRRLVHRGPYSFLRNPMYLGATVALAGAALYYRSLPLFAYAVAFIIAAHLFVVAYEEPALRAKFGEEYLAYCRRVGRWLPRAPRSSR
jgi:protein-S-isoprenylcysteine O-methyltransferase Ste14